MSPIHYEREIEQTSEQSVSRGTRSRDEEVNDLTQTEPASLPRSLFLLCRWVDRGSLRGCRPRQSCCGRRYLFGLLRFFCLAIASQLTLCHCASPITCTADAATLPLILRAFISSVAIYFEESVPASPCISARLNRFGTASRGRQATKSCVRRATRSRAFTIGSRGLRADSRIRRGPVTPCTESRRVLSGCPRSSQ